MKVKKLLVYNINLKMSFKLSFKDLDKKNSNKIGAKITTTANLKMDTRSII